MGAVCCSSSIDFANEEVQLNHFYLMRAIGKGAFGKVRIVRHKESGKEFALKYISKERCIQRKSIGNIISERRLLERIDYPLIVNLRYAFQDDETLFMALDLKLGGDLRFLLERMRTLSELQVRHYVAQIALSLNYLHKRRIAHRDIKPDNVLLDERGHAHLSDFNVAVSFSDKKPLRWSTAGTLAYMAPELVGKQGYSTSIDWWSLGVLAYELLFGKRPFKGKSNDQTMDSILHDPLQFPENVYQIVSEDCVNVLSGLLEKSPIRRLGAESFRNFKSHRWFAGLDWDALEMKTAVPPFIPDSKSLNFDAVHEIEEILLEEPPLRTVRRGRSTQSEHHPVTEEAQWRQMLEDRFLSFDYRKRRMAEERINHPYNRGYMVVSSTSTTMEDDEDEDTTLRKT
ncbi:kinase-like domain-containing protein [Zychaea mexicana]|uniref:kinase-like domain-containing protein n=1 Tax=Zychaea mexicana TaxID=64656 RepID=UPI0022FE71AA|nr:kinase-like domain-containing protein [Zychaea mexicana]KAI9491907.1 kinase-like domain-containing protein [Zychaea mexicana]